MTIKKPSAEIYAVGSAFPERVVTNQQLEAMVDTSDQWIRERTGIRERRQVDPGVGSSDLGSAAAKQALQLAGVSPDQIDIILVATTSPDYIMPSTACLIQQKIGAVNAWCTDLYAACSGWVYALSVAHQYVATQKARRVLVIGAETLSRITNWQDRTTCILFGDGAAAAVVGTHRPGSPGGLIDEYLKSDGSLGELLWLPQGGSKNPITEQGVREGANKIHMNGREIFKSAVRVMTECCEQVMARNNIALESVDWIVPHQANSRIIDAVGDRLKANANKLLCNVDMFGNTSSATVPSVLAMASQDGRLKAGDLVLATVFGGGLTSGAALFRWSGKF